MAQNAQNAIKFLIDRVAGKPEDIGPLFDRVDLWKTEKTLKDVITSKEDPLGYDDKDTLAGRQALGSFYYQQKRYQEAERQHREAAFGRARELGANHPSTLTSFQWLGDDLMEQKKYSESEIYHGKAASGRIRAFNQNRAISTESLASKGMRALASSTMESSASLAVDLLCQGKWAKAEIFAELAVEISKEMLGLDDVTTLHYMYNLGLILQLQEKYTESEPVNRQATEGYERIFGREHPNTVSSRKQLEDDLKGLQKLRQK